MQANHVQAAYLNLPAVPEIAKLIEENLKYDWILRVEHSSSEIAQPMYRQWQQWGDAVFAINDPDLVIENIVACRASHPDHSIRLNAEKVRPRSQFYYCVYKPEQHAVNVPLVVNESANTSVGIINNWFSRVGDSVVAVRARLWHLVTIIGMLLASLLMIEEVMA